MYLQHPKIERKLHKKWVKDAKTGHLW